MKELEFLKIIKEKLTDHSHIGDDCAYLEEFNLFITHDTMVEDVHFSLNYATPKQIGYKAVALNLSDLASCLANPLYITVSLSMPKNTDNSFVKEIYEGINDACEEYDVKVIGGDLTGSEKIIISICAIGKKQCNFLAQRNKAKREDIIFTTGTHGSSAAGLKCFEKKINNDFLKNKHLLPKARFDISKILTENITSNIALMDTSDGLFDAVYKICEASNVTAKIDINKIPFDKELEFFKDEKNNLILFGGEDYELVGTCDKETFSKLPQNKFFKIGEITKKQEIPVIIDGLNTQYTTLNCTFNHF